ncbi:hypothetical protein, partial [Saliniramus sp.]|uniref:hypothetical protein n=1 Tax=Saliniramus sp. TaxID=2986772 RepID=UPI002D1F9A47
MPRSFSPALLATAALATLAIAPAQAQHSHGHGAPTSATERPALPQDALAPFVDPLTIPPRAEPVGEHE